MSDSLRQRFSTYGVIPPASAWEAIAADLAEEQEHLEIRQKLYAARIEPPEAAWENIASLLSAQPREIDFKAAAVHSYGTLRKIAAVVTGVAILGTLYMLVNNQEKQVQQVAKNELVNFKELPKQNRQQVQRPQAPVLAQTATSLPRITSFYSALKIKKKVFPGSKRYLYKSVVKEKKELEVPEVTIAAKPIRNEAGEIIQDSRLLSKSNEKYVSVTGPNGQQTKISAKFVNLLLYLNGDNDSDQSEGVFHKAFLESLIWKSRFQSWRNTISQTAFIPSSTNFMDILEMKDLILQEKDIN